MPRSDVRSRWLVASHSGCCGVTDTIVAIEGEAMRGVTWVVVEEVQSGDWGIGGRPLETSDVKAIQAAGAAR